jgi:hypothetical protein
MTNSDINWAGKLRLMGRVAIDHSVATLLGHNKLPYLWSKGISQYCDFAGPSGYWREGTESCQSAEFFRRHYSNAHGLIWVRLGTRARDGTTCDLDWFAREALPTIHRPFALITTDGDASVPSDLAKRTVDDILKSPWLVSWQTQNYDGTAPGKIAPIPIGLDLHTPSRGVSQRRRIALLKSIRTSRLPPYEVPLRVFSDLSVSCASEERSRTVAALRDCAHVDFLGSRISQSAIWNRYARYPFVLSARGNGIDCHRTWELLYLGCIVITRSSSLDPLFEGLPAVIVKDWEEVGDKANLVAWLRQHAPSTDRHYLWEKLKPSSYIEPTRNLLRSAEPKRQNN